MNEKERIPVLIVGAGPTGLVLGIWLTMLHIPVRIIDEAHGPGETSRALIIHARTLEFYHQIGMVKEIIAAGLQVKTLLFRKDGNEISRIKVGDFGSGLSPYPYILSLPQDDHEKILTSRLKKEGVDVEWGTKLVSFNQENKEVTAHLQTKNKKETIKVKYLCGCDGAHSMVREGLNLSFSGGTYQQTFFVADVISPKKVLDEIEVSVTQNGFCLVFPVKSSGTIRLIGIVPSSQTTKKEITFDEVKESIFKNTGLTIDKANWFSTYHVHHRVVPNFKVGRVFLAGDAAHIHSPVGAQGMNTGIGDAINLSWKLAAVLKEGAHEKLLETYEMERLPFAKKLVSTTDKLFQFITSQSILGFIWRSLVFPYMLPLMFRSNFISRSLFKFVSQIQVKYSHSYLSLINPEAKAQAGERLPWVRYSQNDNFHPLQGLCWQVHVYGTVSKLFREKIDTLHLPLFEFEWKKEVEEVGIIQHAAYLIRPDGYISVIDINQTGDDIIRMLAGLKKL